MVAHELASFPSNLVKQYLLVVVPHISCSLYQYCAIESEMHKIVQLNLNSLVLDRMV